eukprot:TCALIF_05223-PA protein Name:"Protein of unknown function" AED:0.23 eAED:0.59 QI:0/0/0.33/0.66/0/0/3/156/142
MCVRPFARRRRVPPASLPRSRLLNLNSERRVQLRTRKWERSAREPAKRSGRIKREGGEGSDDQKTEGRKQQIIAFPSTLNIVVALAIRHMVFLVLFSFFFITNTLALGKSGASQAHEEEATLCKQRDGEPERDRETKLPREL